MSDEVEIDRRKAGQPRPLGLTVGTWVVIVVQLVTVAFGYGQLSQQVSSARDEIAQLRHEVEELRAHVWRPF